MQVHAERNEDNTKNIRITYLDIGSCQHALCTEAARTRKKKKNLSTLAKPSMDVTKAPEGITGHMIDSGRDKKKRRENVFRRKDHPPNCPGNRDL